jgi:hypothetical protein
MQTVVYDLKLRKPGCVLLQAAMGGTVPNDTFPPTCWLTELTPDMKAYSITDEQLEELVAFHGKRKR